MPISEDPEKRAKQIANLKSFPKGVSGNPKGRKPGIKNWGRVVQDLLADEELLEKMVGKGKLPEYVDLLPSKNGANIIVATMMIKAIQGDMKAANWLRRTGFGEKMIHDFEDGFFEKSKLTIEIVEPKHSQEIEQPED